MGFNVPLYDEASDQSHTLRVSELNDGTLVGTIRTSVLVQGAPRPLIFTMTLGSVDDIEPDETYAPARDWLESLSRALAHELRS